MTLEGKSGLQKIEQIMKQLRIPMLPSIGGIVVIHKKDYMQGIDDLPKANVLKFILEDDSWFAARPSGTEPKIKLYYGVKGSSLYQKQSKS